MSTVTDPFAPLPLAEQAQGGDFSALEQRPATLGDVAAPRQAVAGTLSAGPSIARLHGFDLLEQPLIGDLAALPGQVLPARATVALSPAMKGRELVVWFEGGDPSSPIIMGVLEPSPMARAVGHAVAQTTAGQAAAQGGVHVMADGERQLIEADKEIVLRCGDASITLTRAGKVIIQGNYILSRSTGYNKIKGAAIDIN